MTLLCSQNFLIRPFTTVPRFQQGVWQSQFSCPISKRLRSFIKCQYNCVCAIICLLFFRRPSHVTHVRQEILETVQPPITHGYIALTVPMVAYVAWVCASLNHILPCKMFWGMGHSVCDTVGSQDLFTPTPTTFCSPSSQTKAANNCNHATHTLTVPLSMVARHVRSRVAQNRQAPESPRCQIYKLPMCGKRLKFNRANIWVSHAAKDSPFVDVVRLAEKFAPSWRAVSILPKYV